MLVENMTLKQMLEYQPNKEDLAIMPLQARLLIKLTIIGEDKEKNYGFLRSFFQQDMKNSIFYASAKTIFYDFDATEISNSHKFITIAELYSELEDKDFIASLAKLLEGSEKESDVYFEIYSLQDSHYQVSIINGEVSGKVVDE